MNRQIKFRAKRLDNVKWVYGDLTTKSVSPRFRGDHCIFDGDCWHVVDPSTIGQFTGLTDANGKDIYEGDILKMLHPDKRREITKEVYWKDDCAAWFMRNEFDDCPLYFICDDKWEVVSSVFENPDLPNQ